ncbi:hypothetical protein [Candidatus Nanohalococcus occultus]|uniref:Uncharacterized protein n=1 Tax=Candidatus Nanohalococcus occultus TaxID=2978047 RepID=A0ABY8CHU6_9ARCH|nr:hypothetical protein SVXNc_0557 [Candidatus Nanohaloarchaeota archaeon SVXNc]
MSEQLHSFEVGPYEVMEYTTKMEEDGKAVIEVNGGDLGRITIENLETIEQLREALEKVEMELMEKERRGEEL